MVDFNDQPPSTGEFTGFLKHQQYHMGSKKPSGYPLTTRPFIGIGRFGIYLGCGPFPGFQWQIEVFFWFPTKNGIILVPGGHWHPGKGPYPSYTSPDASSLVPGSLPSIIHPDRGKRPALEFDAATSLKVGNFVCFWTVDLFGSYVIPLYGCFRK